jgi:hypothetical protein
MPPALRILVLGLFLTVFGMVGAQQLFGVVGLSFATAELLDEYAPTEEDRRLAAELQARAVSAGSKVKVTPMDVANARRQGQLSTLERSFDAVFTVVERRPVPEPGPTHQAEGAFYRDVEAETEAQGPSPCGRPSRSGRSSLAPGQWRRPSWRGVDRGAPRRAPRTCSRRGDWFVPLLAGHLPL